jgi:hypothetical protein
MLYLLSCRKACMLYDTLACLAVGWCACVPLHASMADAVFSGQALTNRAL